jgi:hypothetical protein
LRHGLLLLATALVACGRIGFDRAEDAPGPCPSGYGAIPGGTKYRFEQSPTTWIAAELACEAEGTHLAVPDSAGENAALVSAFAGTQKVFIGISDRIAEGTFVPVTGGTPSFLIFGTGEPNGGSDADGVSLRANSTWGDEADTDLLAFVCECDGKPADPTTF